MKALSLPDPFRETTSCPSFFTSIPDPADHHDDTTGDDTTLNKRRKTAPGDDTTLNEPSKTKASEPSETSPFKVIPSTSLSSKSNEMNENHFRIVGSFPECDQFIDDGELLQLRLGNLSDPDEFRCTFRMSESTFESMWMWVKSRSKARWDLGSSPDFPDAEFKRAFKMSKSTFEFICSELDPVINEEDTKLRLAIPVRQRVAVCLLHLATGEPLRVVSKKFGLGISTCQELVLEVCGAIKSVLMNKFLSWPDEEKMTRIKGEFEQASGIPNVGGSMYTTHVPIFKPKVNGPAYLNKRHTRRIQRTSYSITVQGVVDAKGVFTDICIGWPGSMSDEQILEKSALSQRASRGLYKDVWIVGNRGYPLTDWVLVPYAQQDLWTQRVFNEKVGEAERVANEAFSRLKGRWSCLQKRTEVKLQDLPVVLAACCVLHNVCEMRGETVDDHSETSFDLFDDEIAPENPVRSADAVQARDQIARRRIRFPMFV